MNIYKIFLFTLTLSIFGCSVYESQGRKDFEDSRDFQIVLTSFDSYQNQIQLSLDCQNIYQEELRNQQTPDSTCGIIKTEDNQLVFHKQLRTSKTQFCKPQASNSDKTLGQLSFFEKSYCELENN